MSILFQDAQSALSNAHSNEPYAELSLGNDIDVQPQSKKTSWTERFRETPSWLTSFLIHLLCFVAAVSIASPNQRGQGAASIVLNSSFAKQKAREASSVRTVRIPQDLSKSNDFTDLPTAIQERNEEIPTPSKSSAALSSAEDQQRIEQLIQESERKPKQTPQKKYAALTMRLQGKKSASASAFRRTPLLLPSQQENNQHDEIVDRFIQYDVGQLRGAAGVKARKDFQALGPNALPALVRGLNRSADIHATCPVGVIASKLLQTLRIADSPAMTQYAIDNIGQGVSENAPHYRRIISLRDRFLSKMQSLPQKISDLFVRRGLNGNGETLEIALSLADGPNETIIVALESNDEDLLIPALIAFLQKQSKFSYHEMMRAGRQLSQKKNSSSDEVRKLAEEAANLVQRRMTTHSQPRGSGRPILRTPQIQTQ